MMTNEERSRWEHHGMKPDEYRSLLLTELINVEREFRWVTGCGTPERLMLIISIRRELDRLGETL
jgi:hypothetical protein